MGKQALPAFLKVCLGTHRETMQKGEYVSSEKGPESYMWNPRSATRAKEGEEILPRP